MQQGKKRPYVKKKQAMDADGAADEREENGANERKRARKAVLQHFVKSDIDI